MAIIIALATGEKASKDGTVMLVVCGVCGHHEEE